MFFPALLQRKDRNFHPEKKVKSRVGFPAVLKVQIGGKHTHLGLDVSVCNKVLVKVF